MFKLLVLSCLLVSCLADPFGLPSWFREAGHAHRHPRGCADRAQGWRACARLSSSESLAPHGRDCSLFFYCSGGARPACRKCPAGLHFNPQLQVCDWPANANCTRHPPRPHRNGTTPYPTTSDVATVTVINGSTTTNETTAGEYTRTTDELRTDGITMTDASSTEPGPSEAAVTNATSTRPGPSEAAVTNATSTEPGPSEAAVTNATSTEPGPSEAAVTNATSTEPGPSEAAVTNATSTEPGPSEAAVTNATSTEPSVFSWRNYIPWGRK